MAWNGTELVGHRPLEETGTIQAHDSPPADLRNINRLLTVAFMQRPLPDGKGADDGSLVSFLKSGRLRPGNSDLDGHACRVLDCFAKDGAGNEILYATLWIDGERGALPLRCEFSGGDGPPTFEQHIKEAVNVADGRGGMLWLPSVATLTTRLKGGVAVTEQLQLDVEKLQINPPLNESDFSLTFGPGTVVNDTVSKEVFTVPASPEEGERINSSKARWGTILLLNAVFVAGFVFLLFHKRRAQNVR
jgi:hypothetical protein